MATIFFNDNDSITIEETYEDVSIAIYEAHKDNYPFIRFTIKEQKFNHELAKMESIEREIQINISHIVLIK